MSLTGTIDVKRISAVDPENTFKDATEDINRETASLRGE